MPQTALMLDERRSAKAAVPSRYPPSVLGMPAEILAEICHLSVLSSSGFNDIKMILSLLGVSQRIRAIAVNTHGLWCSFDAGAVGINLLPSWLSYSRDSSISFRLDGTGLYKADIKYMLAKLCTVSSRWREASFAMEYFIFPHSLDLRRLVRLVLDVRVFIQGGLHPSSFRRAPSLRSVELIGMSLSSSHPKDLPGWLPWSQLHSLAWHSSNRCNDEILRACSSLRCLAGVFGEEADTPQTNRIVLPHLTRFKLLCGLWHVREPRWRSIIPSSEVLSRLTLPMLSHLEIAGDQWSPRVVHTLLDNSQCSLRSLRLYRAVFNGSSGELRGLLHTVTQLEALSLEKVCFAPEPYCTVEEAALWDEMFFSPSPGGGTKMPILPRLKELVLSQRARSPHELIRMVTSRMPDQVYCDHYGSGLLSFSYIGECEGASEPDPVLAVTKLWTSHGMGVYSHPVHSRLYEPIKFSDDVYRPFTAFPREDGQKQ